MSLWQSYRSLAPRTRALLGIGLIAWAGAGIFFSDQAEKVLGLEPSEEDRKKLEESLPSVRVVERGDGLTNKER